MAEVFKIRKGYLWQLRALSALPLIVIVIALIDYGLNTRIESPATYLASFGLLSAISAWQWSVLRKAIGLQIYLDADGLVVRQTDGSERKFGWQEMRAFKFDHLRCCLNVYGTGAAHLFRVEWQMEGFARIRHRIFEAIRLNSGEIAQQGARVSGLEIKRGYGGAIAFVLILAAISYFLIWPGIRNGNYVSSAVLAAILLLAFYRALVSDYARITVSADAITFRRMIGATQEIPRALIASVSVIDVPVGRNQTSLAVKLKLIDGNSIHLPVTGEHSWDIVNALGVRIEEP